MATRLEGTTAEAEDPVSSTDIAEGSTKAKPASSLALRRSSCFVGLYIVSGGCYKAICEREWRTCKAKGNPVGLHACWMAYLLATR